MLEHSVDTIKNNEVYEPHFQPIFYDHHEHKQSFWRKYIFATDHKMIAKQYLISGIIWSIIGVGLSVLFRLQLGWPEERFEWMRYFIGKWVVNGRMDPQFYYSAITMHGTIMVFFVLTAGLSGTFSNLLIPLQIGARDMAAPFINMLSYWFFFLASLVMLASFFVETGPAAGGWTAYPPLSVFEQANKGSGSGMTLWLMSMSIFIISALMGGLNYITTVLNMRARGLTMMRLPLTIWAFFFTAVIALLSFPVLLAASILLIFDRSLGTSFYLNDIFIGGQVMPNSGGSPILYQHLFWFLGHPEVYIVLLPAMGMVSEIIATNSKKPVFGYLAMVGSIFAIAVLSFVVWAHHMFVSGMNPFVGSIFVIFTLLIAVPSAVKVFNWLTTIWRGNITFTPATLFALGFVSLFISGGLTGLFLGNSAIDIEFHDTYFVVAHFHIVMGLASSFGFFAGVYHWFPKMYAGRMMNMTLGYIHFWITIVGSYCIFWPMHYLGLSGLPRRYFAFNSFENFSQYDGINMFVSTMSVIVFFAQFLFVVNFFYSMYKGRKMRTLNPWKSTTLEWTTPINVGHDNWVKGLPEVHRWAYDYSKDGYEYIPQHVPEGQDHNVAFYETPIEQKHNGHHH